MHSDGTSPQPGRASEGGSTSTTTTTTTTTPRLEELPAGLRAEIQATIPKEAKIECQVHSAKGLLAKDINGECLWVLCLSLSLLVFLLLPHTWCLGADGHHLLVIVEHE